MRYNALTALGLCLSAFVTTPAHAQAASGDCAAIAGMKIEATNLLSSASVTVSDDLPGYCRVLGYVRPAINFEIRLPTDDWNGKFYMAGCGGFCGTVDADRPGFINAINYALKRGYAVATMDGGHWGSSSLDARWASANPVGEADWGWRAVQETTRVAKLVTETFYAQAPAHSYFQGCSTGGRMAHMVTQRQAEDFDGVISGAPAMDYPGLVATAFAWVVQANTGADGAPILGPDDAPVVQAAVVAACDAVDGVEDGMISDPRACSFDPASLICGDGQSEGCLSAEKAGVVAKWYESAKNSAGEELYPGGVPVGSEAYWGLWLTGFPNGGGNLIPGFNQGFLRYMAFDDDPSSDYTAADFNLDTDPARTLGRAAVYNSDNPDLSAFTEAGGKLLIWHGWADAIVFPGKTVDFYEKLAAASGGMDAARDHARLFMVPGVDHCGILSSGPGISQAGLDPLSALEKWVEEGIAPDSMPTTKTDKDGATVWARPVCAWPEVASFDGSGDWKDPAAWACTAAN